VQTATTVQLVVTQITFAQLQRFKKLLTTDARGVKAIFQRGFQASIATLDVEISGTTEALADELSAKTWDGLRFEITGMSENTIELTFRK